MGKHHFCWLWRRLAVGRNSDCKKELECIRPLPRLAVICRKKAIQYQIVVSDFTSEELAELPWREILEALRLRLTEALVEKLRQQLRRLGRIQKLSAHHQVRSTNLSSTR
jgi:hypothetical protein